ncbi:amino acid ABC transporter permease [Actinomyces glycerinitolerans]|uniref:ABC transmembrane type-1 domain-containing protein n=1 Tax=Actinomyces glycerinitolerans TaxID=1892869 RepID=A0A1M4RYT2_9ACTO|nr:amino acid ABC transporter permease [Actinomyces glycerinitolerans]SHE25091.1 Hypothetical protein ACGLYG10_1303 [Actinomyces glycerinitolerans]
MRRGCRFAAVAAAIALVALAAVVWVIPWCREVVALEENPDAMVPSMVYMLCHSRRLWLSGVWGTLSVSVLGTVTGFVLAVGLVFLRINAPGRRDSRPLRFAKSTGVDLVKLYVTIFRGTPMMVQAAIVYYAGFNIVRSAMPNASITEVNQRWSFFMAALLTVSLNSAAYLVEVLRGGVGALNRGQREAAVSLGFSNWQTMIKVIFPQAVRNSLPSIGNELVNNIKGTSVLTIIGYTELMFATSSVAGFYYKYLANYLTAAVIYLILTLSLTWLLETSMRRIGIAQKEIAA